MSTEETEDLPAVVERRLGLDAIGEVLASLGQSGEASERFQQTLERLWRQVHHQAAAIDQLQGALRTALLEVELLKRAASAGGDSERPAPAIDAALIRSVFPPDGDRRALVRVNDRTQQFQAVDCESRLHLCKAACCRIYHVDLTAAEVESDRYRWDPELPYTLPRGPKGCSYLVGSGCACRIYDDRPRACSAYSCKDDRRIWKDFEQKLIQPELVEALDRLDVRSSELEE